MNNIFAGQIREICKVFYHEISPLYGTYAGTINFLFYSGAYSILKDCHEKKAELSGKIEETNGRIKLKRKHLEELREELRVLGELPQEELYCRVQLVTNWLYAYYVSAS